VPSVQVGVGVPLMLNFDGVSNVEREWLESKALGSRRTSGKEASIWGWWVLQESGTTSGRGVADGNGPTDDDRFWGVLLTFNLPLGADPGRLGDLGGIGGGAPFRPPGLSLSTAGRMQEGGASSSAKGGDNKELLLAAVSSLEGGEVIEAKEQLAAVARESERFDYFQP